MLSVVSALLDVFISIFYAFAYIFRKSVVCLLRFLGDGDGVLRNFIDNFEHVLHVFLLFLEVECKFAFMSCFVAVMARYIHKLLDMFR